MPPKRKWPSNSWARTTRAKTLHSPRSTSPRTSPPSSSIPPNATVIDLRSPSQSTRSKTLPKTNPIPTPSLLRPCPPVQQRPPPQPPPIHFRHLQQPSSSQAQPQHTFATQPQHMPPVQVPAPCSQPTVFKPQVVHQPHPDSKVSQKFHWVPYPLCLLPYDSWHNLHYRANVYPPLPFRCPVCRKERKVNAHLRKAYLVAERLSWEDERAAANDRNLNEELNWAVNYELGILDPFVEDAERVPGGKNSQKNRLYPYQNEIEMKQALRLILTSEDITEASWSIWMGMQADLQLTAKKEEADALGIVSYKTLQDFYSLLDQIERTSYVGALFLEAYAERLRDDMCKDCWFKRYVDE